MASKSCMPPKRHNSRGAFAAWLCLFAAICLYAPLAAAAWPASTSCCDGNHCAIPAHQHRGTTHRTATEARDDMQCQHGAPGMTSCSMQCCQQLDHLSLRPMAYVGPMTLAIAAPVIEARYVQAPQPPDVFRCSEPLSPPPRTTV